MRIIGILNEKVRLQKVRFKDLEVGDIFISYSEDDYPDPTPDNSEASFWGKLSDDLLSAHTLFHMRLPDGWEFEGGVEKVVTINDGERNYFSDDMFVSKIVAKEEV